jgi:hypothetical protein
VSANDTYTWSKPTAGDPFFDYVTSAFESVFFPFDDDDDDDGNLQTCYFATGGISSDPATKTTPILECKYFCATNGQTYDITAKVNVLAPTFKEGTSGQCNQSAGTFDLIDIVTSNGQMTITTDHTNPTDFRMYGAVDNASDPAFGLFLGASVSDPAGFGPELGQWGFVQVLHDYSQSPPISEIDNSTMPLTQGYPYLLPKYGASSPYWFTCLPSKSEKIFSDFPGFSNLRTGSPPFALPYNTSFDLYVFYKPPGNGIFVPISVIKWFAAGTAAVDQSKNWTCSDGIAGTHSNFTTGVLPVASGDFPEW